MKGSSQMCIPSLVASCIIIIVFPFIKYVFLLYLCVHVGMLVWMYAVYVWVLEEARGGVGSAQLPAKWADECGGWELNLGLLDEQEEFLTAKPSL